MTQDSYSKRLIRERMALTGEPYSVARRAELGLEDDRAELALERLFEDIQADLAGRLRWLVPHGFEVTISGRTFGVSMPVMWVPERGVVIATASQEPSMANVDELHALVVGRLASSAYAPASVLVAWSPEIPEGSRPGDLWWTVNGRV